MKAFILAAGIGSRLKSLTKDKPKALVEVNNEPMLKTLILKLKSWGISEIVINIHHKGEMIIEFLNYYNKFGIDIKVSDERDQLLDTGGALLKAKDLLAGNDQILVHNVDIINDINFTELESYHMSNNNIATLCVRKRDTSRYLLFDESLRLMGWKNKKTNEIKLVSDKPGNYNELAFSGVYIIKPEFIEMIKQSGSFSIIDTWLKIAENNRIMGYEEVGGKWFDLGTADRITNAQKLI